MSTVAPQRSSEENPLVEGLERLPVHPTALVIFGATGDLAHRKLLPALYNLAHEGSLPERFELVGVSRRDQPDENFQQMARESIERFSRRKPDPAVLDGLYRGHALRARERSTTTTSTAELHQVLGEFDERAGTRLDRVFYLSTAPQFFPVIAGEARRRGARSAPRRRGPDRDREAVRLRPRLGAQAERRGARASSTSRRCSGSITTSARRRSRT